MMVDAIRLAKKGVGASQIWKLFNEEEALNLYLEKLEMIPKEEATPAMEAGNKGEWFANEIFKRDFLPCFQEQGFVYTYQPGFKRSTMNPSMVCFADGIMEHQDGRKILIEYKTVQDMTGIEILGKVPDRWLYQIHGEFRCYDDKPESALIYCFIKQDLMLVPLPPIKRNKDFANVIGKICDTFWNDYVVKQKPLPMAKVEPIKFFHPDGFLESKQIQDKSMATIARRLFANRQARSELDNQIKIDNGQLLKHVKEHKAKVLYNFGTQMKLRCDAGETRIDIKQFLAKYPDLKDKLEEFTKPSQKEWIDVEVLFDDPEMR